MKKEKTKTGKRRRKREGKVFSGREKTKHFPNFPSRTEFFPIFLFDRILKNIEFFFHYCFFFSRKSR